MPLFGPPNVEKLKAKGDVKGLIKALGYEKDPNVRQDAAGALGALKDPQAVEPLIFALEDWDWDVRRAVVEALAQIGGAKVMAPLLNVFKIEARGLRRDAAEALHQAASEALAGMGPPAVEPLITALKNEDKTVRQVAAKVLGGIGDVRAVESLIGALGDEDGNVRETVAQALDQLGWQPDTGEVEANYRIAKHQWDRCVEIGTPAVKPLIAIFKDESSDTREVVAGVLKQIGNPRGLEAIAPFRVESLLRASEQALGDEKLAMREAFAERLSQIGPLAVEPLIHALKHETWEVRQVAAWALGRIGPPAVEPLILALEGEEQQVRKGAAWALGDIGDVRAVEPLIRTLEDEDRKTPLDAVMALGWIGDARAVEPLIHILENEDEAEFIRHQAVVALGEIGGAQAVDALVRVLREVEDVTMRIDALRSLRKIKAKGMDAKFERLIRRLGDRSWMVREEAAGALAKVGPPALEALTLAMLDENSDMREAAAWVLGKIRDSQAVGILTLALGDKSKGVRDNAFWALTEIGPPAVELLIRAFPNAEVNIGAAHVLIKIGQPAVEPLIRALVEEENVVVQRAAILTLAEIGGREATEALIRAMGYRDKTARTLATQSVKEIGRPAVEPLIACLKDEDEKIRKAAAGALKTITGQSFGEDATRWQQWWEAQQ
jgi:HEAT repeat protein